MTSLPSPVQSVLDLFQGPLSNVRFADIDAAGLANLATEVEAAAAEVQQQEEKLAELRQGLAQRQEALLVLAQQALAYARVYAENDEPLLEELSRISLPRAAKPRKAGAPKAAGARDAREGSRSESAGGNSAGGDSVDSDTPGHDTASTAGHGAASDAAAEAGEEAPHAAPVRGRKPKGRAAQATAS
jgi:hypothetical protein